MTVKVVYNLFTIYQDIRNILLQTNVKDKIV